MTEGTPAFESDSTSGGFETMRDVLADGERRLASRGVPSPAYDASALLAQVMGIPRNRLILRDPITNSQQTQFEKLLMQRMNRVPLQHIVGTAAFRHIDLFVGPGVFIPRPETELLGEAAIRFARNLPDGERIVVDLCSGSGAVALSVATEAPGTEVHAVELSDDALVWLRKNVDNLAKDVAAVGSSVTVHSGDATRVASESLSSLCGRVGVIACNPPYVPIGAVPRDPEVRDHDPALALFGGVDGLDVVRAIIPQAEQLLMPGGLLLIEHSEEQGKAAGESGVPGLLAETGEWTDIHDHVDLTRRPRFTSAKRR